MPSIKQIIQQHPSWIYIKEIQCVLNSRGFEAFLVGGCVRDFILGREPSDLDMATNATPEDIESLFPKTLMIGKSFGVSIVLFKDVKIEVATFRHDVDYFDGRHPNLVAYGSIQQDSLRRDFTVNALFYDLEKDEIIDLVGGQNDLQRKQLRCVGDPDKRFNEDHLRMMRAIRFSAQLGFEIESKTWQAIVAHHEKIIKISQERIRDELLKLLKHAHGRDLRRFGKSKLLEIIFPEWLKASNFCYNMWDRLFPISDCIKNSESDMSDMNMTALIFFYLPLSFQAENLRLLINRLKLSGSLTHQILRCIEFVKNRPTMKNKRMGELIEETSFYSDVLLRKIFKVLDDSENMILLEKVLEARQSVLIDGTLPKALITGNDAGKYFSGKELGVFLRDSYWSQLEREFCLKEEAIEWLIAKVKTIKAST